MENLNQNQEENNKEVVSTEESVEENVLEVQSKESILTKKFPQVWGLVILLVVTVVMSGLYLYTNKQSSEIKEVDIQSTNAVKQVSVNGSTVILQTAKIDWSSVKSVPENAYADTYLLDKDGNELGLIKQSGHTYPANKGSKDWNISNYWTGSELAGDSQEHQIIPGEYKIKLVITETDPVKKTEYVSDVFEVWPSLGFVESDSRYINKNFGFEFKIPEGVEYEKEYIKQEYIGSENVWYKIEFKSSERNRGVTIEIDPDGYGPLFSNLAYDVEVKGGKLTYDRNRDLEKDYPWADEQRTNSFLSFRTNSSHFLVSFYSHDVLPEIEIDTVEKMIESFRFDNLIGDSLVHVEENEMFKGQFVRIFSFMYHPENLRWEFDVDLLDYNEDFIPGSDSPYFLERGLVLKDLYVDQDTGYYLCDGVYPTKSVTQNSFINKIKAGFNPSKSYTTSFDIENDLIINMYQQCLP